jgi:hypothetical protein
LEIVAHRYRTHVYRRFQGRRRVRQAMIKTMDTYSHVMPGMGEAAATALEDALS